MAISIELIRLPRNLCNPLESCPRYYLVVLKGVLRVLTPTPTPLAGHRSQGNLDTANQVRDDVSGVFSSCLATSNLSHIC